MDFIRNSANRGAQPRFWWREDRSTKAQMRATEHNKPAKAWPIGANRTKFIPWPALPVSTFLAVRRATKYWFDAHTMDGGCTCCCTCSTGFNNNPTGRKKTMHTFLFDWWKCIHNPYVSAWLPIPKYLSTNTPLWARCSPCFGVANGCQNRWWDPYVALNRCFVSHKWPIRPCPDLHSHSLIDMCTDMYSDRMPRI